MRESAFQIASLTVSVYAWAVEPSSRGVQSVGHKYGHVGIRYCPLQTFQCYAHGLKLRRSNHDQAVYSSCQIRSESGLVVSREVPPDVRSLLTLRRHRPGQARPGRAERPPCAATYTSKTSTVRSDSVRGLGDSPRPRPWGVELERRHVLCSQLSQPSRSRLVYLHLGADTARNSSNPLFF